MDLTTIIVAAIVCGVCVEYFKYKTKMKRIEVEGGSDQESSNTEEIKRLKERIANLEKIVTDRGYQLGREIEAL